MPTTASLLLALPLLAQGPDGFEVSQELLDDAVATARPAVERALGYAIPEGFAGARVAEVDEIEAVLEAENRPILASQFADEAFVAEQAELVAANLAPALLAKYAFESREILVSPEGFERNAEGLGAPELLDPDVVRATVVHELVHAADVPRHDFLAVCTALGDTDRVQALNALLEGHAQHVARRVCAELGLAEAHAIYGRAIVGVPIDEGDEGEGMRLMRRAARERLATTYVAGERFAAALAAAGGEEAVARAFRDPPEDMGAVHRPEWYLDPASRPRPRFTIEAGLDRFAAEYAERGWQGVRTAIDVTQLALAFEAQGRAVVERIQTALLAGRMLNYTSPDGSAAHYALVCEWTSAEEAEAVLQASLALLRSRDEAMKKGAIRIVSAEYEDVALEGGVTGVVAQKQMRFYGEAFEMQTVVLRSGALTAELLRSPAEDGALPLSELGRLVLAAAAAPAPAEGAPQEGAEEDPPADGTSGGEGG